MFQVKGKWALITGAARGIGYLTARFIRFHFCDSLICHKNNTLQTIVYSMLL